MKRLQKLLVVPLPGSRPESGLLLKILLKDAGLGNDQIQILANTKEACKLLLAGGVDAVVSQLDAAHPGAIAALREIRDQAPNAALVTVSDNNLGTAVDAALGAGADDCLRRSEASGVVLRRALHYALDRRRSVMRLRRLERYDPITGLLRQQSLLAAVDRQLQRARARRGGAFALALLRVEGLAAIERTLGGEALEDLLFLLAERLEAAARPGDGLGVLDSRELVVVLQGVRDLRLSRQAASRIASVLQHPLEVGGRRLAPRILWGTCLSAAQATKAVDLVAAAQRDLRLLASLPSAAEVTREVFDVQRGLA